MYIINFSFLFPDAAPFANSRNVQFEYLWLKPL